MIVKDERCGDLFEALNGTLRAAKKRKVITFEGEMLLQGMGAPPNCMSAAAQPCFDHALSLWQAPTTTSTSFSFRRQPSRSTCRQFHPTIDADGCVLRA